MPLTQAQYLEALECIRFGARAQWLGRARLHRRFMIDTKQSEGDWPEGYQFPFMESATAHHWLGYSIDVDLKPAIAAPALLSEAA